MSKGKGVSVNDAVLDYLTKQNRPYSAIDVFNNLHKEHGKAAVVKALEQLAEKKQIIEKVYGKQKVYYVNQNSFELVSDEQIIKMDSEISQVASTLKDIQSKLKNKENILNSLNNSLTTEGIKKNIEDINQENKKMVTRLKNLKSNANHVSPEVKDKILKENQLMIKEWRRRKRMANDVMDAILEGYSKGKKALLEETGVETDEDAKISLPT